MTASIRFATLLLVVLLGSSFVHADNPAGAGKDYAWKPFSPVNRPVSPQALKAGWGRNPIDAFIAAEHETRGLKPRPEAERPILLRRLYLDLIGLPPTREELHAFLADSSTDAYEKVVDRLLNDPRHGERWGRHWMDVWRYADWAGWGAQIRDSQPHIWHWRDWIVESLNRDKGYGRMVLEMLAADELCPKDADALRGVGFLARNFKLLSREKWLEDTIQHTSEAFLGVTLACCRCHDHPFDSIPQKEYYRVRAIFEPHQVRLDRLPGQPDINKDGLPLVYDANLQAPTYLFIRGDERTPEKTPLNCGVPSLLGGKPFHPEHVKLPADAYAPDKREFVIAETLAGAAKDVVQARQSLEAARSSQKPDAVALAELNLALAEARKMALEATVLADKLTDAGLKDSDTWKKAATEAQSAQRRQVIAECQKNLLAVRQALDAAKPVPEIQNKVKAAEEALAKSEAEAKKPLTTAYTPRKVTSYPVTSTGRRLALARWIADRDHPLTARVAMNHIWLRHFGQAIVPTVQDFGRNGRKPSHPALLDWLAAELMDHGWSMKHMHRLIVCSSAYRMASTPDTAALAIDRDNVYLWRMSSRRLEAEAVRDCVFYVAGKLDPKMGGPDIPHSQGLTTPRRSIYFQHAQEKQMEFLKLFDAPAVTECYQRKQSVQPQQALALSNSELTRSHARTLALQLPKDEADFATAAFERILSRPPTDAERAECMAFFKSRSASGVEGSARARESLVHVLLNHHEFVTIR